MNKHHEEAIDRLDASIFSGDLLESAEGRDAMMAHCTRWLSAVQEAILNAREDEANALQAKTQRIWELQQRINDIGDELGCKMGERISMQAKAVMRGRNHAVSLLRQHLARPEAPEVVESTKKFLVGERDEQL